MKPGKTTSRLWAGLAAAVLSAASAPAAERLLAGFENLDEVRPSGKAALVRAADAVTEGHSALELAPGAAVTVTVPAAAAADPVGWLKIDTFEVRPVMASLRLRIWDQQAQRELLNRRGHVLPGRDCLALPLGVVAHTRPGPWPPHQLPLEIINDGADPLVIDNVRFVPPAPAPADVVLLDFGPAGQDLWPGFEPAGAAGKDIAWSGNNQIHTFALSFPDPLAGDFAGRWPQHKAVETLSINCPKDQGAAWIWVAHYAASYSMPVEHLLRLNGRVVLHGRLTPAQLLSPQGLLIGKDQPWTGEWFERSFVPAVSAAVEGPLKQGVNVLELANCQIAALVIAPRAAAGKMQPFIQQLTDDLKKFRRQFVLAAQHRPRCDVVPTEEETRAGVMLFDPPPDQRFSRNYVPKAQHRAKALELTIPVGLSASAALVAVPCKDGASLRVETAALRDSAGRTLPAGRLRVWALEPTPLVRDARVEHQPFLPAKGFRAVREREACWFLLQASADRQVHPGTYQGSIRLRAEAGAGPAELPLKVEVVPVNFPPAPATPTFGVMTAASADEAYLSLAPLMPAAQRDRTTTGILNLLLSADLNAGIVTGAHLSGAMKADQSAMVDSLRRYPRPKQPGKTLIDVTGALGALRANPHIQPGTARHHQILRDVVTTTNQVAAQARLDNTALYCGYVWTADQINGLAREVQPVQPPAGRPAVATHAALLAGLSAGDRANVFSVMDTILCEPNRAGALGLADEFKRGAPHKTFALMIAHPEPYACGFYCWAVGADGAYMRSIFPYRPPFNAFDFDGVGLLLPNAAGSFDITLPLLLLDQAMADYHLAAGCERLVRKAKAQGLDAAALEKVLAEVRITSDARPPNFDPTRLVSTAVDPRLIAEWRTNLIREAARLSEKVKE